MTELSAGQSLERIIKVYGVESPVILTISHEGISFRIKGARKKVDQAWPQVVKACNTPSDVPCYLADKPLEFLQKEGKKRAENQVKKAGI